MFREIIRGSQKLPLGLHGRSQMSLLFSDHNESVECQTHWKWGASSSKRGWKQGGGAACIVLLGIVLFFTKMWVSNNIPKLFQAVILFLTWITTHTNKTFGSAGLQFHRLVYPFGAGMELSHSTCWKTLPLKTHLGWCLEATFETCLRCFAFFLLILVVRLIMLSHICS